MTVSAATATWLKADSDYSAANDGAVGAVWGTLAIDSEAVSPFAERSAAVAEAARQLGFFAAPLAVERVLIHGLRADLIGKVINMTADRGDLAETRCIVIGIEEQADVDMTVLTLLRRLA